MESSRSYREQDIIAVDERAEDSCGDESEFSTDSLTSSIYEYRYENGRRYQAREPGKYLLPNDKTEQERLDIVHHIYLLVLDGKLTLAPLHKPRRILDIGTGTGIWAIDMAEKYPLANITGTDLSPIQPSWVPPNVDFQIDDAELDWTFERDSFDLVHIRHLSGGIKDWEHLLKEAYTHCKPGGYVEVAEYEMAITSDDGTCHEGMALWQFYDLVSKAAIKNGRDFSLAKFMQPVLEKVGFINVHHQMFKIAVGTWPADRKQKEIGAYTLLSAESGFEAFGLDVFTNVLGMNTEDARVLINECVLSGRNKKIHGYSGHHFYYAQKPFDA